MATLKAIKYQHNFAEQLYGLVDVTQGIAVMRMQQVRTSVLQTRTYMEGIIAVFRDIRRSHRKEVERLIAEKKHVSLIPAKKRGSICILLSASGKFSGQLTRKVFAEFVAHVKRTDCEVAVVGLSGRELVGDFFKDAIRPQYYNLDLEHPTREQLAELLIHILEYENITVFTGKFQSLVVQVPTAYNITGYDVLCQENTQSPRKHDFLFEPSLQKIISFFVAQVTATLMRETLAESKLANLGSRIMVIESSRSSIGGEITKLEKVVQRMKRRVDGRKQSNRLSSMRFWS
jgi:F0F1-type ATP synthase gamma subunit